MQGEPAIFKFHVISLRYFQEILTSDKKNGMAFILLGAAYQDSNKAEAAKYLKSALESSDEFKLLALQGLSNCAKPEELPEYLEQLLALSPEKYLDYYLKLANLVNQLPNHLQLIRIFSNEIKVDDQDRKYQALKNLLNIFMKNRELAMEKHKDEFLECLEVGFQDKDHVYHLDICRDYFKILHQKGKLEELTRCAEEMSHIYSNNLVPLEWICKIYIENESFKISENLKANFGIYVEKLLELNANSLLGLMASGLVKCAIGDLAGARDILVKGEVDFGIPMVFL
jgi:superkiller protein 3